MLTKNKNFEEVTGKIRKTKCSYNKIQKTAGIFETQIKIPCL